MPNLRKHLPPLLLASLCACGSRSPPSADEGVAIEVWYHAGQPTERATLEAQAGRFNAEQDSIRVDLRFLPEGSYNAQVQASAVAGQLPDLLDLDGPYVAAYAWQGHLAPLDGFLSDSLLADLLPSVVRQGTWRGTLYALGTFDSGLALYARRDALETVGAELPRGPADAWTVKELDGILERLAAHDPDGAVLDLKLNYQGEWFTFAFQPALRSAGGGLVEGEGAELHARGVLDGPASREAAATLRSWMARGLVDGNLDDAAFTSGRVPLSWSGHWDFPRYREALGDELAVLPLPDFGGGTRTGQGSWVWTIPTTSPHPRAAAAFLSFLLRPEEVLAMASANGAVPATRTAADRSSLYGPDGPLELVRRQLEEGWAVPRPRTPAYPFVSSVFQDAFDALRTGEAAGPALTEAAAAIDREIRDNRSYPPS